jgi:hypothetical protein
MPTRLESRIRSKLCSIAVLTAVVALGPASRLHAQVYTQPSFAIPFVDDVGRIPPPNPVPKELQTLPWSPPISEMLFLDGTHAVSFLGPSSNQPAALLITDFVSRSVRPLEIGLADDTGDYSLLAGFRPSRGAREIVLLVQAMNGWFGRLGVDRNTDLFVVVLREGTIVSKLGPIEIERQNVIQDEDQAVAPYSVPHDQTESPGPAYQRFARVLLRDLNGDGFNDLLIWKRNFEFAAASISGRRIPEIAGTDYVLRSEQFLVSLYRPSEFGFTAPAVRVHLPPPPESAWKDMRSVLATWSKDE